MAAKQKTTGISLVKPLIYTDYFCSSTEAIKKKSQVRDFKKIKSTWHLTAMWKSYIAPESKKKKNTYVRRVAFVSTSSIGKIF